MLQTRDLQLDNRHEWAVILAGGDGTRLKSLTRKIAGDERPKQFCSVLGGATLLEETQRRTALELAEARTLYAVNQLHEPYYVPNLGKLRKDNLVVQPSNRGTAPAILYSLLRIATRDPDAVVAFFPSDHYISDNRQFMSARSRRPRHSAPTQRSRRPVGLGTGKSRSGIWLDRAGNRDQIVMRMCTACAASGKSRIMWWRKCCNCAAACGTALS